LRVEGNVGGTQNRSVFRLPQYDRLASLGHEIQNCKEDRGFQHFSIF